MGDRSAPIWGVGIAFFIITWISVGLRIWVRAGMIKSFGPDDWTMLGTQLLNTAYLACQLGGLMHGTGRHIEDLDPEKAQTALTVCFTIPQALTVQHPANACLQYWLFCEIFYVLTTSLLKVSIGYFLLRVATNKLHVWIVRTVMVLTVLFGPILFFVFLFQCKPVSAFWSLDPHDGKCLNSTVLVALVFAISGLNVVADWTFGLLPFWIVKDLQIPVRQKRLVIGLLAFAAVGSTATVVRLPYVLALKESGKGREGDFLCKSKSSAPTNER